MTHINRAFFAIMAAGMLGPTPALAQAPETVQLTGVVRDFRAREEPDGHVDFEAPEPGNRQYTANLVLPTLGTDGKPVFNGGANRAHLVRRFWKDSQGQNICECLPDLPSDQPGEWGGFFPPDIASATSFSTWYNDALSVNASMPLTLTLVREGDDYVYDDMSFFPIDGLLLGNYEDTGHNYHFTFELHTTFTYDFEANHVFSFRGDDDVWVFINGQLVIDLGGRHGPKSMVVELNRLTGLVDEQDYALDFFSAERHTDGSHVRITTNILLRPGGGVTISGSFD